MDELRTLPLRTTVRFEQFEAGVNVSTEGLAGRLNVGFSMVFASCLQRDIYLSDPEHRRLGALLVELVVGGVEGIRVFDMHCRMTDM